MHVISMPLKERRIGPFLFMDFGKPAFGDTYVSTHKVSTACVVTCLSQLPLDACDARGERGVPGRDRILIHLRFI